MRTLKREPSDRARRPGRHRAPHRLRFKADDRVKVLLALGTLVGVGATGTLAAWTDSATATSGTFSAGTIDIKLGTPLADNNPTDFSTNFAMANMGPGSSRDAVLRVNNAGSLPFNYALSSAATNALGDSLTIAVYTSAAGATTCNGTALATISADGGAFGLTRSLAASGTEYLCFRATLPNSAPSSLQGGSSVVTLTFSAST